MATTKQDKINACVVTETAGGWSVASPSGNTYAVESSTRLDECGSMYFTRHCSCPARGDCVHMSAVNQYQRQRADADDMDVLDRVE